MTLASLAMPETAPRVVMLKSVDNLRDAVSGPLTDRCGTQARMLTAELHGDEVRGLALCPGRVVRFVLDAQTSRLSTVDLLRHTQTSRKPAA